jgi:hypothetical protein
MMSTYLSNVMRVSGAEDDEHVLEQSHEGEHLEHQGQHAVDLVVALHVLSMSPTAKALLYSYEGDVATSLAHRTPHCGRGW